MESTEKLPRIFLLVSSLEAEELVFTDSPEEGKDWATKQLIELTLRDQPSYGQKRLAIHLKLNKKRIQSDAAVRYQTV